MFPAGGWGNDMLFHIVVNPAGASGKTGKIWMWLEPVFRESGQEYRVHFSTRERGIGEICRTLELQVRGTEDAAIVVVGGDGSVNEAINGFEHPGSVLFGHIPAGSGNDLTRDMGLPRDLLQLTARILEGRVHRTCDIGELTYMDTHRSRRFAVSCGIGFDAGVCEMASRSRHKSVLNRLGLGKMIYLHAAFRIIGGQHCGKACITLEEGEVCREVHYDRILLLACMNHQYEGGGFRFTPDADADDGILNLCAADPKKNRAFYQAFPLVPLGRHLDLPYIHELRGNRIEIQTSEPMWVHTDGEVERQADHLRIRIMEEKLRLLI